MVSRSRATLYVVSWGGRQGWREGREQDTHGSCLQLLTERASRSSKCSVILGLRWLQTSPCQDTLDNPLNCLVFRWAFGSTVINLYCKTKYFKVFVCTWMEKKPLGISYSLWTLDINTFWYPQYRKHGIAFCIMLWQTDQKHESFSTFFCLSFVPQYVRKTRQ